jgi:hypothetical protein
MDLLSEAEKAEVAAAIKDVTDTFFKDQITYQNMSGTFSRMGNNNNAIPTNVSLLGRVTYKETDSQQGVKTLEGIDDKQSVEMRFNANDLRDANVMINDTPSFNMHKDYFIYEGLKYLLTMLSHDDSDFAGNIMIVVCTCERQPLSA